LRITVAAAAVIAALAATSLILHANHDFGPWPNSRTTAVGSIDWRKTLPDAGVGMWTTSDSVVVATENGLTAYSISNGEKLWSWAPPSGRGLCAMSPATSEGRGVVAYGARDVSGTGVADEGLPCTAAQAIDIETGKAAWPEPVDLTQGEGPIFAQVAMDELSISGGFVVAPYGESGFASLDAKTGALLWTSNQLPEFGADGLDSCPHHDAQALDGEVYAISGDTCSGNGASATEVAVFNAARFAPPQVLPLPDDDSPHCASFARTIFATPTDVLVTCETFNGQSYPAYAIPPGTPQLIPLVLQQTGGITAADVGSSAAQLELTDGFVSGGDLLVESVHAPTSAAALTGFDLTSGAALWRHTFPTGTQFSPLGAGAGAEGEGAGAQGVQISGDSWTLLSISPTSGATSPTAPLNSTALSGSGINGSFDDAVVCSYAVVGEFGTKTTVVVSTL
jgi:hypothetical protein